MPVGSLQCETNSQVNPECDCLALAIAAPTASWLPLALSKVAQTSQIRHHLSSTRSTARLPVAEVTPT